MDYIYTIDQLNEKSIIICCFEFYSFFSYFSNALSHFSCHTGRDFGLFVARSLIFLTELTSKLCSLLVYIARCVLFTYDNVMRMMMMFRIVQRWEKNHPFNITNDCANHWRWPLLVYLCVGISLRQFIYFNNKSWNLTWYRIVRWADFIFSIIRTIISKFGRSFAIVYKTQTECSEWLLCCTYASHSNSTSVCLCLNGCLWFNCSHTPNRDK